MRWTLNGSRNLPLNESGAGSPPGKPGRIGVGAASGTVQPMRVVIEGSCRSNSRRPAPGQMAQAREKRLARLEDLEAGAAKRLLELGGAEVSMLALAKELEGDRRQEPAQCLHRRA